jgi:hypothetical protein
MYPVQCERLKGNATTDFGAPGIAPSSDAEPVDAAELQRFEKILKSCWKALDEAIESAAGKTLRTGPRGSGRQLDGVLQHVLDSNTGYLNQVGWKFQRDTADDLKHQLELNQRAVLMPGASASGDPGEDHAADCADPTLLRSSLPGTCSIMPEIMTVFS